MQPRPNLRSLCRRNAELVRRWHHLPPVNVVELEADAFDLVLDVVAR